MPAKNIEKGWKLPKYREPPVVDLVRGHPRPWWYYYFNSTGGENKPKICPLCKVRMALTKTAGKSEFSCFECAHLHYRTIKIQIGDDIVERTIYIKTEDILEEQKEIKKSLKDRLEPK